MERAVKPYGLSQRGFPDSGINFFKNFKDTYCITLKAAMEQHALKM
jgi:hypothetical protein